MPFQNKINEYNCLYILPFVVEKQPFFFAIDNVDFPESTPTGKDAPDDMTIVMYQKKIQIDRIMVSALEIGGIVKKL